MKSNNVEVKYLFISRKSSHYRYYKKLVSFLGASAELVSIKLFPFPRLSYWMKACELDIHDLVDSHMRRKQVRHPLINKIPLIVKVIRSIYEFRERCRASYYYSILMSHSAETVILWNGMKQPNRTPYIVAKSLGKKTFLFENGLLPNTTTLDDKGVNASNSVPREPSFYREGNFSEVKLNKELIIRHPHKNRKLANEDVVLPKNYIFVPFQVPNDTQIVCHSPWIDSMDAFYLVLETALAGKDISPQMMFVIKEHPSWPRSFKHLHNKHPRIIFANNMNTQYLVEQSSAVVTINSTVGIEALLLNKKVITLGNSFFNIDGLVWHAENQQELINILTNIDDLQIDEKLVNNFLSYLQSYYLIPDAWQDVNTSSLAHLNEVKHRLETL